MREQGRKLTMKRFFIVLLCVLFTGLCACVPIEPSERTAAQPTTTTETTKASSSTTKTSEITPYSKILKERLEYYRSVSVGYDALAYYYYALYDIDGNSTRELLLGENSYVETRLFSVYTIRNGVAVRQEQFSRDATDTSAPSLLFKNGTIRTNENEMGIRGFGYYRFEDGELKHLTGVIEEERSHGAINYFRIHADEQKLVPSTKEEFERVQKEFEGDGQVVEIDWKPLAEYGVMNLSMKKLFILLLCTLFAGICACGQITPPEGTTIATTTQEETTLTTGTEATASTEATAKSSNLSVLTTKNKISEAGSYSAALNTYIQKYDYDLENRYYTLYDIDGNGAKELLLGAGRGLYAIYAIQDGVAVRQEQFRQPVGSSGPAVLFKNGIIRLTFSNDEGQSCIYYYRFEDGELKRQTGLIVELDDYFRYTGNDWPGAPLSKKEFERLQKKFEGDGQVVEIDWKPLAEYGMRGR
jgi:hypothetical protein